MFLEFKINKNEYKLKCANIKLLICKRLSFQKAEFFAICEETNFFVFIHFTVCLVRIEL